ncbi:MAG: hypothetical protein IPI67_27285 [Myxococcales bacterium]|nr:hypothetical protein [Myxococcales bacterium]
MKRLSVAVTLVAMAVAGLACTPEMRAKRLLGKYEKVFATCKQLTEAASLAPGEHSCSKVASLAVEGSLRNTGLEETSWRPMLGGWLTETGFTGYYVDSSRPTPEFTPSPELAAAPLPASNTGGSSARTPKTAGAQTAKVAPTSEDKPLVKPDAGAEPTKAKSAYGVGSKVSVLWGGKYWPCTVLAVKGDKYLVHYDGWASKWDEWVTTARMR